jgi:MFS family permease
MAVAGIFAPFIGLFIDRTGPKSIYLVGIGLLAISYLTYGIAHSWLITIVTMAAYWLGYSTSIHSCATICGTCLANKDRATGMMICETVTAGILGMASPMLGAWIVTKFGGANTSGIRPIFFVCLTITISTFVIVLTQLSNRRFGITNVTKTSVFFNLHQVLKEGHHLKRWLVIAAIAQLPISMIFPIVCLSD